LRITDRLRAPIGGLIALTSLVACGGSPSDRGVLDLGEISTASLGDCIVEARDYTLAIGDLTGADTLANSLDAVGRAFDACSTAKRNIQMEGEGSTSGAEAREALLAPLIDLLDTMSLHTIVLAIGVADPTVFDAGPAGAEGFRGPIEHLLEALEERAGLSEGA